MPGTNQNLFDRHYHLLRRLHSLTGIVPVGMFLIVHLLTNASVAWGELLTADGGVSAFKHEVAFIHSLPFLIILEVLGIWLPIAFHSILGLYYATTGRGNARLYPYGDNWRYTLQRWSGYIGLLFIVYHVATLRWGWDWLPLSGIFDINAPASTVAIAFRGGVEEVTWRLFVITAVYFIGVSMLVYHFANGLWTAAITWGLTISETAQKRWGYVCTTLGVLLLATGLAAVFGFALLDPNEAREIEGVQIEPAAEVVHRGGDVQ